MIIPPWIYVAGGLLACTIAFGAGWAANDWRHDGKALEALADATKAANASAKWMLDQGKLYEKDRQDDQVQSTVRESTINTIYRDHPVPADCAVPDAAGLVLDDAIAAANARRAGQSGGGLPPGGAAPVPVP